MSLSLIQLKGERAASENLEFFFWVLRYLMVRYRRIDSLQEGVVRLILACFFANSLATSRAHNKLTFLKTGFIGVPLFLDKCESSLSVPFMSAFKELFQPSRSLHAPGLNSEIDTGLRTLMIEQRDDARARLQTHNYAMTPVWAGVDHAEWYQYFDGPAEDQDPCTTGAAD